MIDNCFAECENLATFLFVRYLKHATCIRYSVKFETIERYIVDIFNFRENFSTALFYYSCVLYVVGYCGVHSICYQFKNFLLHKS